MATEAPPVKSFLTSIEELSEGIFNQPIAERTGKEEAAAQRLMTGKAPPKDDVPPPKADPPPVAPAPGVHADENHQDDLVVDGMKIEQPAEIKSEQGKKSWKVYKDTVAKKITEYEKRIKDMEAKVSTSAPDMAALKGFEEKVALLEKERADLNERLGQASIERTPEFEKHYVKRQASVIEDVKAAVGKDHAEKVEAILQMPDGSVRNAQINEMLTDMDELQKIEIGNAVKELRQISKEKKEQVENWKTGLSQREKIMADKQAAETQNYSKTFDSVMDQLRKEQPLFAAKDGDAVWTDRANKMAEVARDFYMGKGTPHERAKGAAYAVFSGVLMETLKAQNEEMGKLQKQLESMRGKQPVVDGGGAENRPAQQGGGAPGGKPESAAERISRMSKEAGFVK